MNWKQVTNRNDILDLCRIYMRKERPHDFFPLVRVSKGQSWNGRIISTQLNIEGARPLTLCIDEAAGGAYITFTNSDSNYCQSIGMVALKDIEEITIIVDDNIIGEPFMNESVQKIARGVAEVRITYFQSRLGELLRTLTKATVWDRVVYLFTGKIPKTAEIKVAKRGGFTLDSYEDWLVY